MGQKLISALIVEDNGLVSKLLAEMLRDLGFSVTSVDSIDDARRAMTTQTFDCLLTDLNLHHEPAGLALAQEAIRDGHGMKVVLTSGHPAPDAMAEGIGFLPKPFTVAQLRDAIGR